MRGGWGGHGALWWPWGPIERLPWTRTWHAACGPGDTQRTAQRGSWRVVTEQRLHHTARMQGTPHAALPSRRTAMLICHVYMAVPYTANTHSHAHTHIHTHARTRMHTHTHTHTPRTLHNVAGEACTLRRWWDLGLLFLVCKRTLHLNACCQLPGWCRLQLLR